MDLPFLLLLLLQVLAFKRKREKEGGRGGRESNEGSLTNGCKKGGGERKTFGKTALGTGFVKQIKWELFKNGSPKKEKKYFLSLFG